MLKRVATATMVKRSVSPLTESKSYKKAKSAIKSDPKDVLGEGRWKNWPAPSAQIENARAFFKDW